MDFLKTGSIIAAVRTSEEFEKALKSRVNIIFDLSPDLMTLNDKVKAAHEKNKKLFIHIDLATGIGKDKSGIMFAKSVGVDGIISTRVNMIKMSRELEMFTVQRFFIVDSHSVDTTVDTVKASKTDMVEIMPGIATKAILKLKSVLKVPIIAGGLIESETEVRDAIESGVTAVSTGKNELWDFDA